MKLRSRLHVCQRALVVLVTAAPLQSSKSSKLYCTMCHKHFTLHQAALSDRCRRKHLLRFHKHVFFLNDDLLAALIYSSYSFLWHKNAPAVFSWRDSPLLSTFVRGEIYSVYHSLVGTTNGVRNGRTAHNSPHPLACCHKCPPGGRTSS